MRFCPHCGTPMVNRRLGDRQRAVCPACGYIHYVNPIVAAGTLVDSQQGVLLIRRGVAPAVGKWALPAGYAEARESPEKTAMRETFEETGVRVALDGLLDIYSFVNDPGPSGVLILYAAHIIGGELRPGDDATEASFFMADALPDDIAFEAHRKALVQWAKAKTILCRLATPEDIDAIACIAAGETPTGERLAGKDKRRHPPETTYLVAMDVGQVVGFIRLERHGEGEVSIDKIYVQSSYRRWGIGTRLLTAAKEWAMALGAHVLLAEISVMNPGLMLFTHAGFRVYGFSDRTGETILSLRDEVSATGF